MTARVWKFLIGKPDDRCRSTVTLPHGAKPLSVGIQDTTLVLWALVTNHTAEQPHSLIVANTGDHVPAFPDDARFLGTVTSDYGIVWHIWDDNKDST